MEIFPDESIKHIQETLTVCSGDVSDAVDLLTSNLDNDIKLKNVSFVDEENLQLKKVNSVWQVHCIHVYIL